MKLGNLELSVAETLAFRRLIAVHITKEDRAAQAEHDRQAAETEAAITKRNNFVNENVTRCARETARRDGPTSIPPYLQARAAWEAFTASEGWLSRYDVDDHWEPDAEDAEDWEYAYTGELDKMRREA